MHYRAHCFETSELIVFNSVLITDHEYVSVHECASKGKELADGDVLLFARVTKLVRAPRFSVEIRSFLPLYIILHRVQPQCLQ